MEHLRDNLGYEVFVLDFMSATDKIVAKKSISCTVTAKMENEDDC